MHLGLAAKVHAAVGFWFLNFDVMTINPKQELRSFSPLQDYVVKVPEHMVQMQFQTTS